MASDTARRPTIAGISQRRLSLEESFIDLIQEDRK